MGAYIHFTDEQKLRANNVDLVDILQRRREKLIPSGREKRLASDHSITVRGNEWYDHSAECGGYAIDFVRQFYNLSYPEAVTMLLGGKQGEVYHPANQKQTEPKKPFALPNSHSDMRRVYAYLVKTRLLDREVVGFFARQKLLYESCEKSKDGTKEYHNAVFVGFDEHGIPRHAHKRGLYTEGAGFKGNVDGAIPVTAFITWAPAIRCSCLRRQSTCCPNHPASGGLAEPQLCGALRSGRSGDALDARPVSSAAGGFPVPGQRQGGPSSIRTAGSPAPRKGLSLQADHSSE